MEEKEIIIDCIVNHQINDLPKHINNLLNSNAILSDYYQVIDVLEDYYISMNASFLSGFLFLLYDKIGNASMARYYLQYCYDDFSYQKKYYNVIDKYVKNTPSGMNSNYDLYDGTYKYDNDGCIKEYSVHSFSNKIGKNMTLLITPYGSLIFDCGALCRGNKHNIISKQEILDFLNAYHVKVEDIKGVFVSHAHLDHYGSIRILQSIGIPAIRFYSDERTKKIIKTATGEDLLSDSRPVSAFFVPYQKIKVHAYDNGHIVGSQSYVVRFDNITIIYTGDFCLHNQSTVRGWNLDEINNDPFVIEGVECLITESTYGQQAEGILPYDDALVAFEHIIKALLKKGYKIFLPSFAIGRSQELALLTNNNKKVLVDGLAINMTQTIDSMIPNKIMNGNVKFSVFGDRKIENFELNDIIIASSGMIAENSTSAEYMEALFNSGRNVAIIRTGYMDDSEESYGYEQLKKWHDKDRLLFDIPLSAHASYDELMKLIALLSPRNVIAIHGPGILHAKAHIDASEALETPINDHNADANINCR